MDDTDSPEELPSGWTVHCKVLRTGRKVSIYTNLETGKRFFSKDDLFKHIKAKGSHSDKPPSTDKDISRHEESTLMKSEPVNEKDKLTKWLPNGWKVEVKIRKSGALSGKEYKCYIDPSNSGKFYSKLEVLRYLETVKHKGSARQGASENYKSSARQGASESHKSSARQEASENYKSSALEKQIDSSVFSEHKVVIRKCVADDLPPGWIKEIKIRQSSNTIRKDPFYTDPVSGYVFRSKKDALRYVQTGVISKSAFKSKISPIDSSGLMKDEVSTSFAAKRQKLKHLQSRPQLFLGKKGSDMSDLELSKTESIKITSAKVSAEAVTVSSRDEIVQSKLPLNDKTKESAQADQKCAKNSSTLAKYEGSRMGRDKSSPFSDASVSERGRGVTENAPVSTPAQGKGNAKEARVNPRKSVDKKVHDLPPRSSKRLAGHEPDKVANLELGERAFISAIKKSRKAEAVQDGNLTSDGSTEAETKPESEFANHASNKATNPVVKDSPRKSTVLEVLCHDLETERANDNSEQQLSFLFGSDPCLEFAFKTLIGELPLDDTSENEPTNAGGTVPHENLLETGTKKKSTGKGRVTRSKSKNKQELNLPRRSSKRLSGGEPELVANSSACKQTLQNASTKPHNKGTVFVTDFLGSSKHAEQLNKIDRPFDNLAAPPRTHETGKAQLQKSEPNPRMHEPEMPEPDHSFSIADYWSDPCLDFAFKTLTGVIPIDDSLVQGYFLEQLDVNDGNKNGSATLPDYGSSSLFQTDVSSQFDAPEKSSVGQQVQVTPSLLPASNTGFASCSGVHSQQQSLEGNKDLHQKVKS